MARNALLLDVSKFMVQAYFASMVRTVNAPLRAVIYARISHDPDGKAEGVARQEAACRKLAAELGWVVVGVKSDDDRTAIGKRGQRARRPGYAAVLDLLAARAADAVLVWHTDRLYRQARDLEPLIDIVDRTHAVIRPVVQGELDLSSASGRMIARILASVSTHEVEHAVERMRDKHAVNRAAGVNHGGPRAFGYRAVKPKAKGQDPEVPQVDESEAELIRMAADAVLAHYADPDKGLTLAGICRAWNAKGARTPRGNDWTVPSLRKTLLSARIAGLVEHRGEIVGPAQWGAIIEHDVWLAVRNVLTDPARASHLSAGHDGRSVRYLGSGLYQCHCGAVIRPGGAHAGRPQQYRCTERAHLIRQAAPVDDFVEKLVIARLCREGAHALFTSVAPEAGVDLDVDLDVLEGRHKALTARLEGLAEAFAGDDDADPVEYREAARRIKQKVAAVEQKITDAATAAATAAAPSPLDDVDLPELVRRQAEHPDQALSWWRARYGLDVRRRIVAALISVTLLPARTGRPAGWSPGQSYFDPESVDIEWVTAAPTGMCRSLPDA